MFYRVQNFSFSNIDRFSTASIVTRLTSDVANLQMTFQMMIRMAFRSPMMLILAMFSAMRISTRLSMIFLAALPILMVALAVLAPMVFKIFDRAFRTIDRLNTIVQENIHGIRVVKSFVRAEKETEKFTDVSTTICKSALHIRWPKYWSFSFNISPSNEYSGLISFRMDWLLSMQSKGLSRLCSNTTVQKHQFFGAQPSSQSNSHIHT